MKVIVATDGSEFSVRAIENLGRLIDPQRRIAVKIVSAYDQNIPLATEPFALSAPYYQEMSDAARAQCDKSVSDGLEILKQSNANDKWSVETEVRLGTPGRVIVEAAREWNADLIVVGSHGRGFWGRLTLGSVSDAVLHHAPCSVLVVR